MNRNIDTKGINAQGVFALGVMMILLPINLAAQTLSEDRRSRFPIVEPARQMVEQLLIPQGGLKNPIVIDTMKRIPRHRFVPPVHQSAAYFDQALSIGNAQTISPPYIVAYMTEQIDPKPTDTILEIGTGSGYQAAVLSLLAQEVYTIEIVEPLGLQAERLLKQLGMKNVHVRIGDGYQGWAEAAPFDSIIVTCSPESVPQPLIDQLKEGGRMMIPVGERYQQSFYLGKKVGGKLIMERQMQTLFVPMTGEAEEKRTVLPDASKPALINGNFQETDKDSRPLHWHYARNVTIAKGAENGQNIARFVRKRPEGIVVSPQDLGFSQMLQGFALDGLQVSTLRIECTIRGEEMTALDGFVMTPTMVLLLYDENRNQIDEIPLGRAGGTFEQRKVSHRVRIRPETREAVFMVGLLLSTGRLDVGEITLKAE